MRRGAAAVVCVVTGLVMVAPRAAAEEPPAGEIPEEPPTTGQIPAEEGPQGEAPPDRADDVEPAPSQDGAPAEEAAPTEDPEEPAEPRAEPDASGGAPTEAPPPEEATEEPVQEAPPPRDPERARLHQRLGRAYYSSGRFEEAAREFERAHGLSGYPELLYDLFLARRDAGRIDEAIHALQQFLVEVPDAPERDRLTARLNNMRRLQARRDKARTPGGEAQEVGGENASPDEAPGAPDAAETQDAEPAPQNLSDLEAEPEGRSMAPWIVMGLGAALLVSGAVTGGLALKAEKNLEGLCGEASVCPPGSGFEAEASRGRTLATATDVMLGLGVAAMGAGVALYFLLDDLAARAPTRPDGPTASVGCSPGGCMGTMRMRF